MQLFEQLTSKYVAALEANKRLNCFLRLFAPDPDDRAPAGPLTGLTFAVKDSIAVRGRPVSCGRRPPVIGEAAADAGIIATLRQNGAFLLGSTNLDELCLGAEGDNRHYGPVANPARPDCSPLGSSSGSAAAAAAGLVDFALGSDFAGSVRAPAAACRIAGLKMAPGSVCANGAVLFDDRIDSLGLLARSLDNLQRPLQVLLNAPGAAARIRSLFIPAEELAINPSIEAEFSGMTTRLAAGFEITYLPPGFFAQASRLHKIFAAQAFACAVARLGIEHSSLPDAGRALLTAAARLSPAEFDRAAAERRQFRDAAGEILSQGMILTPALPCPVPSRIYPPAGKEFYLPHFLSAANLLGLPALVFPLPGIDIAPQLIGQAGSEYLLLRTAADFPGILAPA